MRNTLSNPAQFGYVHGRSTESHLISCSVHRIIGDWMSSLNLRVQIEIVYADSAKAYCLSAMKSCS